MTSAEKLTELTEELRNFEEIARHIKPGPGEIPQLEGIDICDLQMPLRGVGGDHLIYIDFNRRYDLESRISDASRNNLPLVAEQLARQRNRAGILLADVSGHRTTDALIAAMLHQAFLLGVYYELDNFGQITTRVFEQLNSRFYRTTAVNKYFTMIYGEISDEGRFRFLSAGHQPPVVFSREYGRFMNISEDRLTSFPPVGMLPSSQDPDDKTNPSRFVYKKRYEVNELNLLANGDILLLFTDGLSDLADGAFFPDEAEKMLSEMGDATACEICDRLRSRIRLEPPQDDISLVVIRKTG